jgi:hypothetical protein
MNEKKYSKEQIFEKLSLYSQEIARLEGLHDNQKKLYVAKNMLKFWQKQNLKKQ